MQQGLIWVPVPEGEMEAPRIPVTLSNLHFPEFFNYFRGTMREEIVSYCQQAGLATPVSNPRHDPIRPPVDDEENPHTPVHPKRPREEHIPAPRDEQGSDREDGELLSDEEEVDFQLPAPASRFFKSEDYIYNLKI